MDITPEELAEMEDILAETKVESMLGEVSGSFISMLPDGSERKEAYEWSIAGNPISGWVVWSHETGTHKKVSSEWQCKDLTQNNFSEDNKPSYLTVNLNGSAIPTVGTYVAGIEVQCNIEAYILFKGFPFGSSSKNFSRESPIFYIHP